MKNFYFTDGSFDNGDPNTTNLYLGNLNPKVKYLITCSISAVIRNTIIIPVSFIDHRTAIDGNIWKIRATS